MSELRPRSMVETRRGTRRALGAAAALLALCASGSAAAQGTPPLRWTGPEGCPSEAAVRAEVERLTAGSSETARVVEVAAHVARDAAGFRVRVETTLRDGRAARDLAAPTCRELADATATIVALMIDPASAERATAPACVGCTPAPAVGVAALGAAGAAGAAAAAGATGPAGAAASPGAPAGAVSVAATAPPGPAATPPVVAAAVAPGAAVDPRTAQPSATRAPLPARTVRPLGQPSSGRDAAVGEPSAGDGGPDRWSIGARVRGDVGTLPSAALGAAIVGGVTLGRVRLELAGGWFPGREVVLEGARVAGGELSLYVADATGCYRFRQASPALDLCGGVELDHMRGSGLGMSREKDGSAWWASALGSGRVSVPLAEWMSLDAEVGAALALGRPEFVVEGMGAAQQLLHQPSLVAGRGAAGASFHFR